jgi:hypothetical protein
MTIYMKMFGDAPLSTPRWNPLALEVHLPKAVKEQRKKEQEELEKQQQQQLQERSNDE